ncbi:Flp pilus assembly protein CpaB [Pseudothauera nasutitermitis]|uniref:Flp pilus assembly protein CpaB n=1 Tax=Pseudothauera nasutitermitis TaxID=2565930 RepID=UPI001454C610|nr:Flp pilus assembly protein CpaB [Pseudothauera nasutitermitis]
MKTSSVLLLAGALTLAAGTALVARVLMKPPPPVTIIKEVEAAKPVVYQVLAARRDLSPGAFLDAAALEWRERPEASVHASHFTAAGEGERRTQERSLTGAALRRPLAAGEPLSNDMLVRPGEPGFIAAVLSPGMRAISIPTSAVSSNAGLVSAGDWVDVILSLERGTSSETTAGSEAKNPLVSLAAQTILRHVRVLALNNNAASIAPAGTKEETAADRPRTSSARPHFETLTLEVTPEAAEKLAVAKEAGTLQVALRGVHDEVEDIQPAAARQVTRIDDATAIFRAPTGSATAVTVKTFQGNQQGVLSFNRAP